MGWHTFRATLEVMDEDDPETPGKKYTLDHSMVALGIARMLKPDANVSSQLKAWLFEAVTTNDAGTIDADVADAVVQFAFFNELVYG